MFAAIGSMACPNLAVPAEVMRHVVDVESGANPYAIGVVGGQLERQPRNLTEALATVHMLDAKGYDYSLGVAQVNRSNLGKYGLDTDEKAFETCPNLAAGARILAACYASSGGDWGKAFSCYYSGNFVTGYRDGYVQKIYAAINRSRSAAAGMDGSRAIPLKSTPAFVARNGSTASGMSPDMPGYRVAIRSVAFYPTTAAAANAVDTAAIHASAARHAATRQPTAQAVTPTSVASSAPPIRPTANAPAVAVAASTIFVPQVTGPNDPPDQSTPAGQAASSRSTAATPNGSPITAALEPRDAAFVF